MCIRDRFQREGNILSTPFYRIDLSEEGRIIQLSEKGNGKPLLDESRGWSLFEPVRETIDETTAPAVRSVLYGDCLLYTSFILTLICTREKSRQRHGAVI